MTPELVAAIIALLTALTAFIKSRMDLSAVRAERAETKVERDEEFQVMRDKIQKCEWENKYLRDEIGFLSSKLDEQSKTTGILTTELAKISVKMDNVLTVLERLTDSKND